VFAISQHRFAALTVFPLSPVEKECSIKTATLRGNIEPPALPGRNLYAAVQPLSLSYSLCVFSNFMQFIFGYSSLRGIFLFLGLLTGVVRADRIICMGLLQCEHHLLQHQRRAVGVLWMQQLFLYRYDDG